MKNFITSIFLLFFIGTALPAKEMHKDIDAFAENRSDSLATVMGTVTEKNEGNPLFIREATVRLQSESDSLNRQTDLMGGFAFPGIKPGKVRISVSRVGYKSVSGVYDVAPGTNILYFQLEKGSDTLAAAGITARRDLLRNAGDTVKVNVYALATLRDDYAIALLSQVPGISISNNKVSAFGKDVSRTYVNGIQVFGDNPLTAFSNIRASDVEEIKIYDEASAISEHRGEKFNRKERVLDIKTREPIVSAIRASVVAEGGADEMKDEDGHVTMRYNLGAKADFYSEMLLFGANGGGDNVNAPPLSYGSAGKLMYPSLNADRRKGEVNLEFAKYWKDRRFGNNISVNASAEFASEKNMSRKETDKFLDENSFVSKTSDTISTAVGMSTYKVSAAGTFMRTPIKSIVTSHFLSYSANDKSTDRRSLQLSESDLLRYGGSDGEGQKALSYKGQVRWQDYDNEKVSPFVELKASYDMNDGASVIIDTSAVSSCQRNIEGQLKWQNAGADLSAGASFNIRNDNRRTDKIDCFYKFAYSSDDSEKFSWDLLSDPGRRVEMASGTYSYSQNFFDNSVTVIYKAGSQDLHLDIGATASYVFQRDNNMRAGGFYRYNWFSVCPKLYLTYRNRLIFSVSTSSGIPSAEKLRSVLDYADPYNLSAGNPSLKSSYSCAASLSYSTKPTKKGLSFTANGKMEVTANPVVRSVMHFTTETVLEEYGGYIAPAGAYLMSWANGSAFLNSSAGAGCNSRLWRVCTLSAGLNYNFAKSPQSLPGDIVDLYSHGPSFDLMAVLNVKKKVHMTLKYGFAGIFDHRLGEDVSTRIKNNISVFANWDIYKGLKLSAGYTGTFQNYLTGTGYDVAVHNLSASVEVPVIRRKLSVRFSAADLLDRGSLFNEIVTATSRVCDWTPSFGRYYLATLIWNFERNKKGVKFIGR